METFKVESNHLVVVLLTLPHFLITQSQAYSWVPPSAVCESSHPTTSSPDLAPALPVLPLQYSMKVEANILQKSKSVEVEEHYDSVRQRASVSITRNGTRVVTIFNFQSGQRYDLYPNGTCNTRPASIDYMGFVGRDKENKPIMATVNDVFRFGTKFNMSYVGKEVVRGINVNHWTSCQNWTQFGAFFQLDYYFSDANFTTATGMTEIPVRAVLNGTASNPGNPTQGKHRFEHSYEFTSFRAGPMLNEEVFQIPPGIVCAGRTDNRPLPPIPDELEMSMEVVEKGRKMHPWEEYLIYDYNHKLVETITMMVVTEVMDFTKAPQGQTKADNDNLISIATSVVRDYTNGLVYVTERLNMTCAVRKMSSLSSPTMAHSQTFLAAAANGHQFIYQGEATVRNMLVDVWGMEQDNISTELYFAPQIASHSFQPLIGMFIKNKTAVETADIPKIFQELFKPEGKPWMEANDKDSQGDLSTQSSPPPPPPPPKPQEKTMLTGDQLAWGLQLQRLIDQYIPQKEINIFHYSPLHLDTSNFQVSQCYQDEEMSHVMLIIIADYYTDVLLNYVGFSNSLRNALAVRVGVSLLHISNLIPTPHKLDHPNTDAVKVTFDLLGVTAVGTMTQKSLAQGKKDLVTAISNGITFHVQYTTYSKDFMIHKSLYMLDYYHHHKSPVGKNLDDFQTVSGTNNSTKYSPSAVAGIAIGTLILGAVLSLGAIFITYRWRHPGEPLVAYKNSSC